jgi:hypothetical protein
MKTGAVVAGVGLVLAACAGPASAAPEVESPAPRTPALESLNIFGVTGLITIPSARVEPVRELSAHFHAGTEYLSYGANIGLFRNLEVGLSEVKGSAGNVLRLSPHTKTMVNAKYAVFREQGWIPAVAVGVTDVFSDSHPGTSFYAVGTKTLLNPTPLRKWSLVVHGGYGTGNYHDKLFGGVEFGLGTPFDLDSFGLPLTLVMDVSDSRVSGGVRVNLPLRFTAEFEVVRESAVGGAVTFRHRF